MTAATQDRPQNEVIDFISRTFDVEAETTIHSGVLVAINAAGYLVLATASNAIRIVGRSDHRVINTAAAGYGAQGQLSCKVRVVGEYFAQSGTTITRAHVGLLCYAVDNQTVSLSDGGGLRPAVGTIWAIPGTSDALLTGQVLVAIGMPSLYDAPDALAASSVRVRNVLLQNVSDLTAYTVAASDANDNVLGVAGDLVLAIAQTTASQNGFYVIGTVASGVASLTRAVLPAGGAFLASQYKALVGAGTLFAFSEWKNTAAGSVATDDPAFRPNKLNPFMMIGIQARNVLNANVADLTAYTVASNASNNDATLGVEGDIVLAIAQTTAAQNGLYRIGTVAAGVAPLKRLEILPSGLTIQDGQVHVSVGSGTVFSDTEWKNTAGVVVGTTDPVFVPARVSITQQLNAGTMTITSIPILSATKTGFSILRQTASNCVLTTGGYHLNGAPTAGALGTASFAVFATVAAGTINNADDSTVKVTVTNW